MRALVIDDSRVTRKILRSILQEIGFTVEEAGNGREALEQLRRPGPFDLALVDWNMPEMTGYEFICRVRADPAFDGVRLMMVTTESEMARVAAALTAGANEFVMKPFTREVIVDKLHLLGLQR